MLLDVQQHLRERKKKHPGINTAHAADEKNSLSADSTLVILSNYYLKCLGLRPIFFFPSQDDAKSVKAANTFFPRQVLIL